MGNEVLIARNLNTFCPTAFGTEKIKLLDKINLLVRENDILGVLGETRSGKTVLIDSIGRNLPPPLWSESEELVMVLDGRPEDLIEKDEEAMGKIWGRGIAFIPSNAREKLNPLRRVGDQFSDILRENFGISREQAEKVVVGTFKEVQMPDPARNFFSYPHELSGGMAQRVVISMAVAMSPRLLLADEPTMGLDVTIQRQVLDLLAEVIERLQSSVILATRDLGIVANYCNKVAVMCQGSIIELRSVRDFFENPLHPYSHFILEAAFATRKGTSLADFESFLKRKEREMTAGNGCKFATHCSEAEELCVSSEPPETVLDSSFYVKCHKLHHLRESRRSPCDHTEGFQDASPSR